MMMVVSQSTPMVGAAVLVDGETESQTAADRTDERIEIGIGEMRQHRGGDAVRGKDGGAVGEARGAEHSRHLRVECNRQQSR
jgi:hypothetical protein